ncbi:hypothetical protein [Pseudomonas sp. PLMAX]|uniref:hypothetical protein n=1 Tax=Pseudomonas sp. PLMAX TaxID=2201998 RepID=UPI0038B6CFD2
MSTSQTTRAGALISNVWEVTNHGMGYCRGHAVLVAAGGQICTLGGDVLRHGKPGLDNPHFYAHGL